MKEKLKQQNTEILAYLQGLKDITGVSLFKYVWNNFKTWNWMPYCILKVKNIDVQDHNLLLCNYEIEIVSNISDKINENRKYQINLDILDVVLNDFKNSKFTTFNNYNISAAFEDVENDLGLQSNILISLQTLYYIET